MTPAAVTPATLRNDAFRAAVARASLAPSVHNTQPARFRLSGDSILIAADPACALSAGDPDQRDAGLSCGAAAEALVLALSEQGLAATVADRWEDHDHTTVPAHRLAASVTAGGPTAPDPLAAALDRRFTHRGAFRPMAPPDWHPADAVLVTDPAAIVRIATLNDTVSLQVLRRAPDRAELLHWMRLSPRHPRWAMDGMNRDALRLSAPVAVAARMALGPLWPLLDVLRLTPAVTAEGARTRTATLIAAFHRPTRESPVTTGRAYLRLTLQAATHGLAMWPMAALADDPATRARLSAELQIPADRRLIQMLRLGPPDSPAPRRARLTPDDLIV